METKKCSMCGGLMNLTSVKIGSRFEKLFLCSMCPNAEGYK